METKILKSAIFGQLLASRMFAPFFFLKDF